MNKELIEQEDDIEQLAEQILDKHFPHSFYYPEGDSTQPKIHDNECNRCYYDEDLLKVAIESYKAAQSKQKESSESWNNLFDEFAKFGKGKLGDWLIENFKAPIRK